MSYVKVTNGKAEIYSIGQLRRDNPTTSFPKIISEEMLESYNIYPLVQEEEPSVNRMIETTELQSPKKVSGNWVRKWKVKKLSQVVVEKNIREERDRLLKENVDTMNPMRWDLMTDIQKEEWNRYRKDLLSVTEQEGFPYDVIWPICPTK